MRGGKVTRRRRATIPSGAPWPPRAPLLAVGHDVETKLFLLAKRQERCVVLRFAQHLAFEPESGAAAIGGRKPGRAREAPDRGRG
jgi:hypothetical protein